MARMRGRRIIVILILIVVLNFVETQAGLELHLRVIYLIIRPALTLTKYES